MVDTQYTSTIRSIVFINTSFTSTLYPIHILWHQMCLYVSNIIPIALQAYVVLGQFLVLKKDEELFIDWIKDTAQANSKQARDCYNCLKDWCNAFLWLCSISVISKALYLIPQICLALWILHLLKLPNKNPHIILWILFYHQVFLFNHYYTKKWVE